mgnify:CR=1 FL=1
MLPYRFVFFLVFFCLFFLVFLYIFDNKTKEENLPMNRVLFCPSLTAFRYRLKTSLIQFISRKSSKSGFETLLYVYIYIYFQQSFAYKYHFPPRMMLIHTETLSHENNWYKKKYASLQGNYVVEIESVIELIKLVCP